MGRGGGGGYVNYSHSLNPGLGIVCPGKDHHCVTLKRAKCCKVTVRELNVVEPAIFRQ